MAFANSNTVDSNSNYRNDGQAHTERESQEFLETGDYYIVHTRELICYMELRFGQARFSFKYTKPPII